MDENQKEALRRSRVFLVTNLIPDSLWDHLIANGIFTDMMLEYIKCKKPRSEQVRSLLSDLNRRHRGAYDAFLTCLVDTGHGHCAQEIKTNMTKILIEKGQSPVTEETLEPNQTYAPALGRLAETSPSHLSHPSHPSGEDVEMGPPEMDRSASLSSYQESSQNFPSSLHPPLDYWFYKERFSDDVYKMESNPTGHVYIINNRIFSGMPVREGSDIDEENIRNMFKELGFTVYFNRDLKASEMRTKLQEFSQFDPHVAADSCVIVILSHGGNQRMYGTDATGVDGDKNYITDDDLKCWFGNQNCGLLKGKPKLFLIQACRGTMEDQGAPSMSSASSKSSLSSTLSDNVKVDVFEDKSLDPLVTFGLGASPSLPNPTDMVIAHSSVEGFVSYRSPEEGSIFIGEVVSVFRKHARDHHVMDLLTKVNNNVATKFCTKGGHKMMPSPTSLLLKKWFLNPPPPSQQPIT